MVELTNASASFLCRFQVLSVEDLEDTQDQAGWVRASV